MSSSTGKFLIVPLDRRPGHVLLLHAEEHRIRNACVVPSGAFTDTVVELFPIMGENVTECMVGAATLILDAVSNEPAT